MVVDVSPEKKPVFKEYYLKLKNSIQEHQLEEFGKLTTDEQRIHFLNEVIPLDNQPAVEIFNDGKDEKLAKELKESGNKAFGKSDFNEALKMYSESILITPHAEGSSDLALTIANRSAALYHLQQYELAINDIDLVLSLNYPKDLKYKILERKAKCLLAMKKHEEALTEFKKTFQALDDCKLSTERKLKMQTDIQIMLGIMTKPMTTNGNLNALLPAMEKAKGEESTPSLSSSKNKFYEAASDKIDVKEEVSAGRFAVAAEDIAAGEIILIEKPYCSVLLSEYSKTNCQHCFKRTLAPYPCDNCSSVIFCSLTCKDTATSTYHKYECKVLKNLHRSGVSVTVIMALRIITQQKLDYFLKLKQKLSTLHWNFNYKFILLKSPQNEKAIGKGIIYNNINFENETRENVEKYKSSDYLNIYHLVRHETLRKRDDFFERSVVALFLLRCLEKGNYFEEDSNKLTEDKKFIGGLLLRHLQILQFNAHEIAELEMTRGETLDESKSLFVGGGLYATLALFNHSCDPGIVRYFDGTRVIVRTIKPIKKGEMVAENYGPIYSQMKKQQRQEKLQLQYWFKCNCIPCEELWPTFDEIDKNIIRFRCDARKENGEKYNDCRNVLPVPINTQDFMIKCFICGQITNLFKGLKTLQDTDVMYKQASKDTNKGNYQAAMSIYLEILTMLHDVLAPPFRDYLVCQQSIRKCMLTFGNKYIK